MNRQSVADSPLCCSQPKYEDFLFSSQNAYHGHSELFQ